MITLSDFECDTAFLGKTDFFADLKYFGFKEQCIDVTMLLWFYAIICHAKNIELINRILEFKKRKRILLGLRYTELFLLSFNMVNLNF